MSSNTRYGFVDLSCGGPDVLLTTSEPAVITWMVAEVKRMWPNRRITVSKDALGEPARASFEAKRDYPELSLYLRKQLCHQGWEPYRYEYNGAIHRFRRQVNP